MLRIKTLQQQAAETGRTAAALLALQNKLAADLDYLAMMCDVEMETKEDDENEPI